MYNLHRWYGWINYRSTETIKNVMIAGCIMQILHIAFNVKTTKILQENNLKTIELTDADYETLMELSRELQTQTNNCQAFPYFWEPSSMKQQVNPHGEGSITEIYKDGETYSPEGFAEKDDYESYKEFLKYEGLEEFFDMEEIDYRTDFESEWLNYISAFDLGEFVTYDLELKTEHNPSLFLSDVQNFIAGNKHHLGDDPQPYSRTIWRMNKMYRLVQILARINKDVPDEEVNEEMKIFRDKK
jgi:hypothetical protein